MSIFNEINDLITVADSHIGYPPTGAKLPFVVSRPLLMDQMEEVTLAGQSLVLDYQFSLYCAGGSVEASWNLAVLVCGELQGQRVGGTTLSTSVGYIGAPVEGHYETQVTVQLNQGGI